MKVRDILALKGNALYTITPEDSLADAAAVMAQKDIGSLVVMSHERVVGILTFREVIEATVRNGGSFGTTTVYRAMNAGPLICTLETELDEVRRMMVDHHARYLPVIDKQMLQGVISFYDVAKTAVDSAAVSRAAQTAAGGLIQSLVMADEVDVWNRTSLQARQQIHHGFLSGIQHALL